MCYHCRIPGGLPPAGDTGVSIPTMRCMVHRHESSRATVCVSSKSWKAACSLAEGLKHRSSTNGHWEGELAIRVPDEYSGNAIAAGSYMWSVRTAAFYHVFFGGLVRFVPADTVDTSDAVGSIGWHARRAGLSAWRTGREWLSIVRGALLGARDYMGAHWRGGFGWGQRPDPGPGGPDLESPLLADCGPTPGIELGRMGEGDVGCSVEPNMDVSGPLSNACAGGTSRRCKLWLQRCVTDIRTQSTSARRAFLRPRSSYSWSDIRVLRELLQAGLQGTSALPSHEREGATQSAGPQAR